MNGDRFLFEEGITCAGRIERGMFFPDGGDNGYGWIVTDSGANGANIFYVEELLRACGIRENPCDVYLTSRENRIGGIDPYFMRDGND